MKNNSKKVLKLLLCSFMIICTFFVSDVKAEEIEPYFMDTMTLTKTCSLKQYGVLIIKADVDLNTSTHNYILRKVYYKLEKSSEYPALFVSRFEYSPAVGKTISYYGSGVTVKFSVCPMLGISYSDTVTVNGYSK